MLLILIALIALVVLALMIFQWAEASDILFAYILGVVCATCATIGLTAYAFTGWSYMAAEYKADIINREYGTNYTQAEVYWAADVINIVRELDRKRIELNGNLMREVEKEEPSHDNQ